jgi:hypothetical protein
VIWWRAGQNTIVWMTVPVFGSLVKVTTGFGGGATGAPAGLPLAWALGAQPLCDPATTWQDATTVTLTPNEVILVAAATGAANPAAATTAAARSPP